MVVIILQNSRDKVPFAVADVVAEKSRLLHTINSEVDFIGAEAVSERMLKDCVEILYF